MLMKSSFGEHTNDQQTQKLEEFLALLEEERIKIEAFKRELPLCMQLLTNAMESSRQQLQSQRTTKQETRPVLEQFIPLNKNTMSSISSQVVEEKVSVDHKANWMTSAQLWNQDNELGITSCKSSQQPLIITSQETDDDDDDDHIKLALNGKQRSSSSSLMNTNGGPNFLPLPFSSSSISSKDIHRINSAEFPELALASSHHKDDQEMMEDNNKKKSASETNSAANTNQTHRKARRCWSPDLHRRFVNALHMLGGSQVATPKQIRELMKVDGLTNDEVKSHLQKYRLHTRRPSPSPQNAVAAPPQLVVLGGIWVPSEYAAGGAQAMYGAANQHMSQDMYPPPPPMHHHPIRHHQFHVYNKPPPMNSLESDVQGGARDQSESIEDEKSETGSWKADHDSVGERKEVDEKSKGTSSTVVGLKF
ncbi:hypothetical protein RD792_002461 [Penstemon davidsonii]|uniref:HTH myb-type domain-containing protein n=1 Tax=Penstemon davidsonii TaxID=160366 RepID=A0ABR0DRZ6_9LAMI|nr:hypothetical protein RD792_002461 [Penstemon davidsonii]